MQFDYSYFEDEIIEGFYVPSLMKRCWAAQMEVLDIVKAICEKNRIKYFADWGTLIGAIRHHGRIPWDDDIDIAMLRKDYEKFRKVVYKELPNECQFFDYRDDTDFDNMVARVINSRYHVVEGENLEKYHGYPFIAGVDIFVYDYLPVEQIEEFRVSLRIINGLRQGIISEVLSNDDISYAINVIAEKTGIVITKDKDILRQVKDAYHKLSISNPKGEYVTDLAKWEYRNYVVPRKCFREMKAMPFSNTNINVPSGYDEFLSIKYGNCWSNPIRVSSAHDYPTYKKQKQFLIEEDVASFFEYKYDKEQLENIKSESLEKVSLIDQIKQFMPLFKEAHETLEKLNDAKDYDSLVGLLADCQNVAIELGTLIENRIGEGNETVILLEKYCEGLFFINDSLQQGNDITELLQRLKEYEIKLVKTADIYIREKKKILFIPYKSEYFNSMYSMYKKYKEDSEYEVDVVVAPYYYKDALGNINKESMTYDKEGYPEDVIITHYDEYDFEGSQIDTIVYQCPYDEYSNAISIHPFFYSSSLRKYTEKLVYIPALIPSYISESDERIHTSLESYVNLPGVLNADEVYIQRDDIKNAYLRILHDFSNGRYDAEKIKIIHNDSTEKEEKLRKKQLMLYVTTVGAYEKNKEKYIEKIQENIQKFQKYKEKIEIVWICEENFRAKIKNLNFDSLLEAFEEKVGNVIYNIELFDEYIEKCDVAYGDGSYVLTRCIAKGKKVMIQYID